MGTDEFIRTTIPAPRMAKLPRPSADGHALEPSACGPTPLPFFAQTLSTPAALPHGSRGECLPVPRPAASRPAAPATARNPIPPCQPPATILAIPDPVVRRHCPLPYEPPHSTIAIGMPSTPYAPEPDSVPHTASPRASAPRPDY